MKSATFEAGLSDHHKLITTILRETVSKGNSKKMFYRDYKRFDQKKFETELKLKLNSQKKLKLLYLSGSVPRNFKVDRTS